MNERRQLPNTPMSPEMMIPPRALPNGAPPSSRVAPRLRSRFGIHVAFSFPPDG